MDDTPALRLDHQGALTVVSFAQPARGNPIDGRFTRGFRDAVAELCNRHEAGNLRAVLLRADGPHFSYGGDLKSFVPVVSQLGPLVREWTADLHMGLQRLWHLPVPIVAAAQGYAMGGALGVMAGCDVVLAARGAKFGSAFAQLGFSCDSGSSVTLTARLGTARARRFVMLAEVVGADEALAMGLVDRVVDDAQLQAEALALAQRLADGPTQAYGEIKRLFLKAGATALAAQLEDEAHTLARVASGADAQEGVRAMAERRPPRFNGH